MVEFTCTCGKVMKAPEALAGKRAKCRKCGTPFVIPSAFSGASESPKAKAKSDGRRDESARSAAAPPPADSEAPPTPEEELAAAFQDFRRKYAPTVWLGCLLLLVVIAGAVLAGVFVHWAVGLVGGVVVFLGVAAPMGFVLQKYDKQAAAAVRDIEARHGLDRDRSLSLIWSQRSGLKPAASDFKPFIAAAWGRDAYQKMLEQCGEAKPQRAEPAAASPEATGAATAKVLPHLGCGYCHAPAAVDGAAAVCQKCKRRLRLWTDAKCPRCGGSPKLQDDLVGGTLGAIVGGILLGGLGAAIGKAASSQKASFYCCLKCRHRWGLELFE